MDDNNGVDLQTDCLLQLRVNGVLIYWNNISFWPESIFTEKGKEKKRKTFTFNSTSYFFNLCYNNQCCRWNKEGSFSVASWSFLSASTKWRLCLNTNNIEERWLSHVSRFDDRQGRIGEKEEGKKTVDLICLCGTRKNKTAVKWKTEWRTPYR